MDIDKLTLRKTLYYFIKGFSTLLDIDKLTLTAHNASRAHSFSTLLDIDKLTLNGHRVRMQDVLVLCWILINLHKVDRIII